MVLIYKGPNLKIKVCVFKIVGISSLAFPVFVGGHLGGRTRIGAFAALSVRYRGSESSQQDFFSSQLLIQIYNTC